MANTKLVLIVAACNNRGIGINGRLPWRLRKDMEFFKKITTETKDPEKKNVVIMGRKTYFSIPEKFRPLPNRINIVLSRELKEVEEGVYIARSLQNAIELSEKELAGKVESLCIIGGASVYKEALESSYPCRIYMTRVMADYECDTFMPEFDENRFFKVDSPEDVPGGVHTEKDVSFLFEVYEKVQS